MGLVLGYRRLMGYLTWCGVSVIVGDEDVGVPLRCGRLVVVVVVARAAIPCANADVGLAVRKSANEGLELRVILDGIDPGDVAVAIAVDTTVKGALGVIAGFMPGVVQVLHEERVALTSPWLIDLLDEHVAASTDNVAHVNEVIS